MATRKVVKKKGKAKAKGIRDYIKQGRHEKDERPSSIAAEPEAAMIDDETTTDIPSSAALAQVATLAQLQLDREKVVDEAEVALESAKKQLREVAEDLLPEAMREAGCESFTLTNGRVLKVKDDISCSLDKDGPKRDKALSWLERWELESIIKREITIQFGKGELALAEKAFAALRKLKFEPDVTETINGQTLKATLKEVMRNGILVKGAKKPKRIDVPLELFNGHAYSKATIGKAPK